MKTQRQAAILELVESRRITSQEELRRILAGQGLSVTQATLSRDIRELGLVKARQPSGGSYYHAPAQSAAQPAIEQLLSTLVLSVEGVANLVVVRTTAGSANTVGMAIDRHQFDGVLGTIAGDDTILVIVRTDEARRAVTTELRRAANLES